MRTRALIAGIAIAGCAGFTTASPALLNPAQAASWPGHPGRDLVAYTVRPGDTLTGLAVRFHAWTSELAAVNHLSIHSQLRVGQHLRIPVVVRARQSAAAAATQGRNTRIAHAVAAVEAHYAYPHAKAWRGHPGRILVRRTVTRGQTLYSVAVEYHAWTRELAALNHTDYLRAGQRIEIPIVVSAMKHAERAAIAQARRGASVTPHRSRAPKRSYAQRMAAAGWHNWSMSRSQIRSIITTVAEHHGVDPKLALAIAWQESGWQEPVISSAGAIGVMQLLPNTAAWMSLYAGRYLNPRGTRDNVLAGVLFLKYLSDIAGPGHRDQVIAGYYQGLTAIGRRPRWYDDTKRYVRSVVAIYRGLR